MSCSDQAEKEGNLLDRRRILLLIFVALVVVSAGDIYINNLSIFESFAQGFSFEVYDAEPQLSVERRATRDAADIESLFMDLQSGMIVVSGDAADQITVTAVVDIFADDEEAAEVFASGLHIKLDAKDGSVVPQLIEGERRGIRRVNVRWHVQVPQHLAVAIVNRFGTTLVEGVAGPVELRGSGMMEVENVAGPLTVDSSLGTVKVVGVLGDVFVKNSVGKLEVAHINGDVELVSATADSTIRDVGGRVTAEVSLGSVLLERVAGDVRVRSGTGSVIVRDVHSRIDVHAEIGNVLVSPGAAAPIDVTVAQGDLSLTIPRELLPAYRFDLHADEIIAFEQIESLRAEQGEALDAHLVKATVRRGEIAVLATN